MKLRFLGGGRLPCDTLLKVGIAVDWARANFNTGQPQWEDAVALEGGLGIQ